MYLNQATGYASQHIWESCVRKGIRRKHGGDGRDGAAVSLDGVAVHLRRVLLSLQACWSASVQLVSDRFPSVQRAAVDGSDLDALRAVCRQRVFTGGVFAQWLGCPRLLARRRYLPRLHAT